MTVREEHEKIAAKIRTFKTEISFTHSGDPDTIFDEVMEYQPELVYYISSVHRTTLGNQTTLSIIYRNQNVPISCIHRLKSSELEPFLREAVSRYCKRLLLVLPANSNFEWRIKCFHIQLLSFFPNIKSYEYRSYMWKKIPFHVYDIEFTYRIGQVRLKQMEMEVNEKIKGLINQLFPIAMPDVIKCYIVHNYLATTIAYYDEDHGSTLERSYVQSAYGALIRGQCVCQGYAEAYKRIMDAVSIRCDVVLGRILTENPGWHSWNIVHLNGRNYHVDVTWDSRNRRAESIYLFRGDDFFKGKREWERFYYTPCSEGHELVQQARNFCEKNRSALLAAGLKLEWL